MYRIGCVFLVKPPLDRVLHPDCIIIPSEQPENKRKCFYDHKEKYDLLTKWNIPVWVMEPVRGGKLAKLPEADEAKLRANRPEESTAAWGFRFLQGLPNVKMVLSGMSDLGQMVDNVKTFSEEKPLSSQEEALLLELAERCSKMPSWKEICRQRELAAEKGG